MPSRRRHREVTRGATGSGDDPSPRAANGEPARAGSTAPRPVAPAGVRRIATVEEASALAALLLSAERCHPVVVITIPRGESEPRIDADEVASAVQGLAEVVVLPTD